MTTRTVVLVGHRSSGKTSIADRLLQAARAVRSAGRVDDRTSLFDWDAHSRRRGATQCGGCAWLDWRGERLHVVDTPGGDSLSHEQIHAMSMADGAIVVVNAVAGVETTTATVLAEAARSRLPCVIALTRAERLIDPTELLAAIEAAAGVRVVPLQVNRPDGAGMIDVWSRDPACVDAWDRLAESVALTDDALLSRYLEDLDLAPDVVRAALPAAVTSRAMYPAVFVSTGPEAASWLLDAVVDALPSATDRPLPPAVDSDTGEDVTLTAGGPFVAQHVATRLDDDGAPYRILRVWAGEWPARGELTHGESGARCTVRKLYRLRGPRRSVAKDVRPGDLVATWEPLPGQAGDTYTDGPRWVVGARPWPSATASARLVRGDAALGPALATLAELDPALDLGACPLTGSPVIGAAGPDHLERAIEMLAQPLGATFAVAAPLVRYLEIPLGVASESGEHRRGTDDEPVEFGRCVVEVSPLALGELPRFRAQTEEDSVPAKFLPAVEAGVMRGLLRGPTGGYEVVAVDACCTGGAYDMFVTTEDHMALAAERAVTLAMQRADTGLLEPWWRVEITVPADEIGAVLGEFQMRRGRVTGLDVDGRVAVIHGDFPERELAAFAKRLLVVTGGRGRYTGRLDRYELLPVALVREAVAASPFRTSSG